MQIFIDTSKCGSDAGAMLTRYEQLTDLYDRATERLTRQHDAARKVARHIVTAVLDSLGVAATDGVVVTCEVPSGDVLELTNPQEVPIEFAVTTNDETNYQFGIILRISSKKGNPSESVLFHVTLRHIMNDRFEVRPFPLATPVTCAATGPQDQSLSEISNQMYNALSAYFTATVKGEPRRPLGFALIPE